MSRENIHHTSTPFLLSHPMPAHSRDSGSTHHQHHHIGQYSLLDIMPAEPKGLHGGESPKNGGDRKGMVNRVAEGQLDDQSSADSGQGDGESDDEDEDEDEGDKTAVFCPAGENLQMPEAQKINSVAGPFKRTFDEAGLDMLDFSIEGLDFDISALADDEPDYPRKKISKHISATTQGMLAYQEPRFMCNDKTEDENEEGDDELTCDDDDGNMTEEEEEAILREFETDEELLRDIGLPDTTTIAPSDPNALPELFDNSLFDDLDGEIFDAMCNDPHRFDDLQGQSAFDWNPFTMESDDGLFSVNPTPDSTPRASISVPGPPQSASTSDDESDDTSEDEVPNLSPFFEKNDVMLDHLVSTEGKGGWSDETDDDADLLKYFFSSTEDTEVTDDEEESDCEDDALTADDGETTDEEEDLPTPTPRHASKLRRASVSPTTAIRPQIIDTNHEGPELCLWVADPSRPICVIEGTKQTFLIPDAYKRFSVAGRTGSTTSDQWIPMEAESENEQSMPISFDPTLTGLTGFEGGVLNGSDIVRPSEAFYPFMSENGDIFSDLFNEEDYDVDEFEARLEINDFLDLSSAEEGGASEGGKDTVEGLSEDGGEDGDEEEEDECVPSSKSNADMFSIWDKVSVTAFRKRQIQHSQKLSALQPGQYTGPSYHKGKEGRLSETITPTKKRRVRQKFLANNRGGLGNNPAVRKKLSR